MTKLYLGITHFIPGLYWALTTHNSTFFSRKKLIDKREKYFCFWFLILIFVFSFHFPPLFLFFCSFCLHSKDLATGIEYVRTANGY